MKKFLSVLLMVAGLMSCGDDDKPVSYTHLTLPTN